MNGTTAYILARSYTAQSLVGLGYLKGAPCTVAGTSFDADGNSVVKLQWKNDAGTIKTTDVTIKKGEDGTSMQSIEIDEDNHLIVTLTDGTKLDAGSIGSGGALEEDLTATVDIGSVKAGKKYPKGTSFESILRDILIKVEAPSVSIAFTPDKTIYDVVNDKVSLVTIKATVGKKTYLVKSVKFYVGTELLENKETGVADGGTFSYSYTPSVPMDKTTTFKVVVDDVEGNTKSTESTISFVGKSYYGFVAPTTTVPTEDEIKAQGTTLKLTKGYVYKNITCDYNKVIYAYPSSMGALTSIRDEINNLSYFNSFRKDTVTVDGIEYFVYTQINAAAANNVELTFK